MNGHRRLDIQGLRAVAVLAVVAFHAGLPAPGGFVGVDVFFVISGFVITGMLRREWESTGRIRFGAFYARRFKRLTPALALVVLATTAFAALVVSPLGAQQTVAKTGAGAMFLVANWVVAATTGGYFDAPAAANPLLHTWSLSVEEQFYLVFPALLALGWVMARRSPRRKHTAPIAVGVVAAASFGVALIGVNPFVHSWLLGFYSPLTRAWEFAAGALLALATARLGQGSARVATSLSLLGAGLLAGSLWLIDDGLPFPGVWTLLPVGGTLLLILAGGLRANPVTAVLASRPLVRVGDWSYSIYLWHWPCIVFATLLWPYAAHARAAAAVLSLAPALLSYVRVEQPIKLLRALPRRRFAVLVGVVVLTPAAVAAAVGSTAADFWTPRYEAGQMPVANHGDLGERSFFRYLRTFYPCTADALRAEALRYGGVLRCRQSKPGTSVDVAVIGDSHAESLFTGFADNLRRDNVAYYLVDATPTKSDPAFAHIVDAVAASSSIKTVVVSSFWLARGVPPDLAATLGTLRGGDRSVFVTDDVPSFSTDPFFCKFRAALLMPTHCSIGIDAFRSEYARYYPKLRGIVAGVPGVHLLRTAHYFCSHRSCAMAANGQLLYRDTNHLNAHGSRLLVRNILRAYPRVAAAAAVR